MMREFRRARRRAVAKPVAVFDLMTEQVIGRLGNLSESGMLLVATEPVVDDALYQLRFQLPESNGSEPIEVGAHLLWQDEGGPAGPNGQPWTAETYRQEMARLAAA